MNLAKESFYTLIFQLTGFVFATIAGIIVARTLGPANKGIVAVVLLYTTFFFTVFHSTLGVAIMHHLGKRQYDIRVFAGSTLVVFFVVSALVLIVFFSTVGILRDTLYKGVEFKYLFIAGIAVPFCLMQYYFSSILQGNMDIKGYNISNQFPACSNLFFVLIFVALWQLTALAAVIAGVSGIILGGLWSLLRVLRKAGGVAASKSLISSLVKDGAKLHMGAIATFLVTQANLFILNYYSAPSEVGYYSVASGIANTLFFFSVSLETGLYPKMAHATIEEAVKLIQIATRQILLMTATAALIMAIFSKVIILVYGGRAFLPSVTPLLLLLPGFVAFTIPKILATLWVRKGWFLPLTYIATGSAVLSLILNLTLIPTYGANGAAIATTLTFLFPGAIELFLFRQYVNKNVGTLFIPRREDWTIYKDMYGAFVKR